VGLATEAGTVSKSERQQQQERTPGDAALGSDLGTPRGPKRRRVPMAARGTALTEQDLAEGVRPVYIDLEVALGHPLHQLI